MLTDVTSRIDEFIHWNLSTTEFATMLRPFARGSQTAEHVMVYGNPSLGSK